MTESSLEEGDRVLVRNVRLHRKHKLAGRWDPVVHFVVGRTGDLPLYTVRPERQEGPLRKLHRDVLLPCGFLSSLVEDEVDVAKPQKKQATRQSRDEEDEECPENYQSSDEDDYAPQISEVPAITSEKLIREYNIIRKPVEVPFNSNPANKISPDIPSVANDDSEMMIPSEAEYLPGTENSTDTQYLPEAESSSGYAESVKENLNERNHSPQVEQQALDVTGGKKREKTMKHMQCKLRKLYLMFHCREAGWNQLKLMNLRKKQIKMKVRMKVI